MFPAQWRKLPQLKAVEAVLCCLCLFLLGGFVASTTTAANAAPQGPANDAASSSATYDFYIACGRDTGEPPSSRCFVGDRIGAFFRSNVADATYTVCVDFPTEQQLCTGQQAANQGVLYVNNVTTSIVGRHTVTWSVDGVQLTKQFVLDREPPPEPTRTCGLLPGDGAYSYIETQGITCHAGKRIARRARERFCSSHSDCLINPPTPITKVYKGRVRYHGWTCQIKDGWELLIVRCRKGDARFVQKSGA